MDLPKKPWLCTKGLARYIGLSPSFFEKGRVKGYGPPFHKIRGSVRYKMEDVDAWLGAHRQELDRPYDSDVEQKA